MDAFIGTIFPWAVTWAPYGYHLCDGTMLTITQYQAVYSLIGTLYGQTNSQVFGLPDLRGRNMLGAGIPVNRQINYVNGQVDGALTSAITAANLPNHIHAATFAPTTGAQAVTIPGSAVQNPSLPVSGSVAIAASTATPAAPSGVPTVAGPNYLAGATAGAAFHGLYATSLSSPSASISGASLSGATADGSKFSPAIADRTVNLNVVNGGAVAVQPGGGSATPAGVSTLSPCLVLSFIFTLQGVYPSRD